MEDSQGLNYSTDGSSALAITFDAENFASIINNRNTRFHLSLANHSLIGVLEAYSLFKRKNSPRYSNTAVISSLKHLEEITLCTIMPIDVTDEFYAEYSNYLLTDPSHPKTPSTILNYFDNIRAALNWGTLHLCPVSETYKSYALDRYEKTKVVLSPSLIAHIYYYDIDKNRVHIRLLLLEIKIRGFSFVKLLKVRDLFVLDCNIAQRYSDASRVDEGCFDETKTIYKTIQLKTGSKARVSITKYAIDKKITYEILNKYNYKAPTYGMDISNFNHYLHLLLRAIGGEFNQEIKTENRIRGTIVSEVKPMWKMITSHTARRTFVSYWLKRGASLPVIQKCTGHRDLRSILAYAVYDDEE